MSFLPSQCRAARALIGWSQSELSRASKVSPATIANFEADNRAPYDRTLADLRTALEAAGVEFIAENGGGAGVRLRKVEAASPPDEAPAKKGKLTMLKPRLTELPPRLGTLPPKKPKWD